MSIFSLMIPLLMIGFGFWMHRYPPKTVNGLFGYRSMRSRINTDTWLFANRYCGRLWLEIGCVLLVLVLIVIIVFAKADEEINETIFLITEGIELILMLGSIIPVELALKRTFDQNGIRKKEA